MAFIHRKLLPEPNSDQTTDCSDCAYPQFYWPPEPPPLPPSSTTEISPFLIVIVAVIGSAVLFIGYYLIMIRYCTRFRRSPVHEQAEDFMNEDHGLEIDHPIWYIATVGLQPAMINSISVVKFKKGHNLIKVADCSVCLSQFQDDELVRLLPKCNHAFHISCIDTWLRSHTNCPLCRAAIVPTASNTVSGPVDQNRNHGFGLNQNPQMENAENNGDLGSNCEICENSGETGESLDSKSEIETVIIVTRSLSMGSAAESVVTESNSGDSTVDLQSLNSLNDSRTRRMMMRSFSCGGNV